MTNEDDKPKYVHKVYAKGGPIFDDSDPFERILAAYIARLLKKKTDKIKKPMGIELE